MTIQRYKLIIEYDGRPFAGWQRQINAPTVQEAVETAVEKLSGETVRVQGSGRTDSGVHASGQVAHFDMEKKMDALRLREALNHHLRAVPVSILEVELVSEEFHARFSAKKRYYTYRIVNRRAPLTFREGLAWHVMLQLDVDAMNEGAKRLVGHHDFTTFRHTQCQAKSPIKTLDELSVERDGEEVLIKTSAQSFLHNQIRSITGTLKMVGEGKWTTDDVTTALEARDRAALGFNAPPDGLYFTKVDY